MNELNKSSIYDTISTVCRVVALDEELLLNFLLQKAHFGLNARLSAILSLSKEG